MRRIRQEATQQRAYAQSEIRRLQADIANKEAILDGYNRDLSKHHLIPGMENQLIPSQDRLLQFQCRGEACLARSWPGNSPTTRGGLVLAASGANYNTSKTTFAGDNQDAMAIGHHSRRSDTSTNPTKEARHVGFFNRRGSANDTSRQQTPSVGLGSGRRLRSDLQATDCLAATESVLTSYGATASPVMHGGKSSKFPPILDVHRFLRFVDSFTDEWQEVIDMPPRSHC